MANAAILEAMRPELLGATRGPVTDSRSCIDILILRQAAESLLHNFGDLGDLPFELANTVANIYYRFLAVGEYIRDDNRPDLIEPFLADSDTDISGLEFHFNMLNLLSESTCSFKHIDACVQSIRDVRNESKLHKYIVRLTLDVIKFNIKAADSKSPLWRAIERIFKRPREIPNLLDCMITEGYRLYGPAHR